MDATVDVVHMFARVFIEFSFHLSVFLLCCSFFRASTSSSQIQTKQTNKTNKQTNKQTKRGCVVLSHTEPSSSRSTDQASLWRPMTGASRYTLRYGPFGVQMVGFSEVDVVCWESGCCFVTCVSLRRSLPPSLFEAPRKLDSGTSWPTRSSMSSNLMKLHGCVVCGGCPTSGAERGT